MDIIVTIQHPGHVHFFRNAIAELDSGGHDVHVFARESGVAVALLEAYGIEYELLATDSDSMLSLATVQATYEARLLCRAQRIQPDVITAIGGVAAAHIGTILRSKSIVFYDTEHAALIQKLGYPFADVICTPACYDGEIGPKQVTYPGYHELAYLHPNRFDPDPTVLETVGVDRDDTFAVVRLSSWEASHDVGQGGFDDPHEVVDRLEEAGAKVLLTAEGDPPADLKSYEFTAAPERMHDLLAFADVVVGEGATTAAEAAVLGTPSVYVNSQPLGYTTELEEEYELLFGFNDADRHAKSLEKAVSIVESADDDVETWERRRERLLGERIDVTELIVDIIETKAGAVDPDRSALATNPS
ncbi:DUF354 domain-containing protein [Halostagnicola sp. A-GB9-2]|uniref:DUF354 domain-containing protein n=1 Tax=Halostagnicola sp. A-GB9-2 TaxID=3048066 RepID=UPI0024BF3633|nr:DUF354 domain-containing protein [Halostagnicola sp. A-GB9-2]MDJ1431840.1 DUF354 domain-containing protein [Halostagnicola sp. A-GB9-2]